MNSYQATIAKIDSTTPIPGADRIHIAYVLGESVIVSKEWTEGMIGVFFPVDCQLSHDFCHHNNLYRDPEMNVDKEKTGFFDKNRKVRAQPFMKVKSCGYFTHLDSLSYLTSNINQFKLGDSFDNHKGKEICRKFVSEATKKALANAASKKRKTTIDAPLFHKHVDTDHFKRALHTIPEGALITIHSKQHGTSARMALSKVNTTLPKWKEVVNSVYPIFPTEKWEYLVGTRNVTLYPDQYDKQSFHGSEQFRFDAMEEVKPYLEKGMTIYGELLGWANGKPIMGVHSTKGLKNKQIQKKYGDSITYSYNNPEGEMSLMIYRITYTNDDGQELDFTPWQLQDWCEKRGLTPSLMVAEPFIFTGDYVDLKDQVEELTEREDCLCEDFVDPSHISEGVIVRVDYKGQIPKFYKSKSFWFSCLEGFAKEQEDFIDEEDSN